MSGPAAKCTVAPAQRYCLKAREIAVTSILDIPTIELFDVIDEVHGESPPFEIIVAERNV